MEFSASEGSSLYIHFPDPYSMQGFISSNVSKKKEKQFFFIETKSRIHRLSCHFRSNLWVMEHFRKVHRFLLNVKTVIKDIFFMRYLKVFVIKNGDDFINSRCALLLVCVTRRFLQASFSLISCYF